MPVRTTVRPRKPARIAPGGPRFRLRARSDLMIWRSGNVEARSKSLCEKAIECRRLALIDGDAREAYLRLARSYDVLAEAILRLPVHSPCTRYRCGRSAHHCMPAILSLSLSGNYTARLGHHSRLPCASRRVSASAPLKASARPITLV
jgi:hypothetical protein